MIAHDIPAGLHSLRPFGRGLTGGGGLRACVLLLGLLAVAVPADADEDGAPPPDPLTPPEETALNQSSYFSGGSVPTSLFKVERIVRWRIRSRGKCIAWQAV